MKNYYKILSVKENASEEEIREHWVELMRKLHPDQRMEGAVEDERVKEINEAYQALKHSSTRVEYDLKRAYDQRKRNSYLRRLSIPIAIFVVFVIIGTIYLKKPQVTLQSTLLPNNPTNATNSTNPTNFHSVINDTYDLNVPNVQNDPNVPNGPNDLNVIRMTASTHQPRDAMTQGRSDPIVSLNERNQTNQIDQINQTNQINQINQTDAIDPTTRSTPPSTVASTHERVSASSYQRLAASPPNRIDAFTPLIATEEEVRRFFTNYIERYTQKDLDNFISLFSQRAVQNRQDGLERIRKIYADFFDQSQEIRYRTEDTKIEIYQNAVEVKALYEVDQILKKGGERKFWKGYIRLVLVKEDGALKILSLDYQPQKSP